MTLASHEFVKRMGVSVGGRDEKSESRGAKHGFLSDGDDPSGIFLRRSDEKGHAADIGIVRGDRIDIERRV